MAVASMACGGGSLMSPAGAKAAAGLGPFVGRPGPRRAPEHRGGAVAGRRQAPLEEGNGRGGRGGRGVEGTGEEGGPAAPARPRRRRGGPPAWPSCDVPRPTPSCTAATTPAMTTPRRRRHGGRARRSKARLEVRGKRRRAPVGRDSGRESGPPRPSPTMGDEGYGRSPARKEATSPASRAGGRKKSRVGQGRRRPRPPQARGGSVYPATIPSWLSVTTT